MASTYNCNFWNLWILGKHQAYTVEDDAYTFCPITKIYLNEKGVIGQKELVTNPNNSEIQMTYVALPRPPHLPM